LQAHLPLEKPDTAAVGRLVGWLGSFATSPASRDSTAMEDLDCPLSPSPSGLRELSMRDISELGLERADQDALSAELRVTGASLQALTQPVIAA
jgi:hypothetical protein